MAFQMEAWLHGRMLCFAACSVCTSPRRSRGRLLPSQHRNCCIQKASSPIFFACSEGRNAVAIFGKRESPQLRIFFAASGAVDVSSSEYICSTGTTIAVALYHSYICLF